jgi:fumarate reductase subunit C
MSGRRPYVRSMDGWWRRDPWFVHYMAREATAVIVVAYAIVLLVGVVRLAQGEAAYDAWLAALRTPASIAFHVLTLAVFAYHTVSWFRIMPKTMPAIYAGGQKLAPAVITGTGIAVAAACCAALLVIVRVMAS